MRRDAARIPRSTPDDRAHRGVGIRVIDDDEFGSAIVRPQADIIPFPSMRANRAVSEAWEAEVRARNQRLDTKHRFPSPLGVLEDLMRKRALPALPWPSAWPELSRRARCHAGDCVGIIGPQGGGKTSFLIQLCRAAMGDGLPVLWCPLELDETQIATRIVANIHGVHSIAVREHWTKERIAHSLAAVDDLWRFVDRYADPDKQIAAMKDAIALAKRVYRVPPLVVIDYLGKLASMSKDVRLATIHAAEELRAVAVAEECYVAILAQPSRSSSMMLTGRSELDNATDAIGVAGESAEVESACRVVIGLSVFKTDDAPELDAHVLVTKSNTGLEGRVGFRFVKAGGVWVELDYLPATPGEIKAQVVKAKSDRHRTTAVPTTVEARKDLNLTKAADVESERRRVLLAAITRCGGSGMQEAAMRKLPGLGRLTDLGTALAELCTAGLVERHGEEHWRIVTGGTEP
jgi:hypothetical protein